MHRLVKLYDAEYQLWSWGGVTPCRRRGWPHEGLAMMVGVAGEAASFVICCWILGILHEAFHVAAAIAVGHGKETICLGNLRSALLERRVEVPSARGWKRHVIRHAGWFGSLLVAALSLFLEAPRVILSAAVLTACEGLYTDLLQLQAGSIGSFLCGNFGVIVLTKFKTSRIIELLRTMVRITMMRGAQCGGVVSYRADPAKNGHIGERVRVINGKRTDLSQLISNAVKSKLARGSDGVSPKIFAGHTRFATTSKVTMDGCHPHQWTPRQKHNYWECDGKTHKWSKKYVMVENYICHNGDLDSFDFDGSTQALETLFPLLERATHTKAPSTVDSAGVAGIVDLVRCKGLWYHSIRYGFIFGVQRGGYINYEMPSFADFQAVAQDASKIFEAMANAMKTKDEDELMFATMAALSDQWNKKPVLGLSGGSENGHINSFVRCAVVAFFKNDLFNTTRVLLEGAKGSFGLMVSSSVDCDRSLALAARGQSISVALYPESKTFLWGSELGAVKAGLTGDDEQDRGSVRLDLDDLGGETILVDWGAQPPSLATRHSPSVRFSASHAKNYKDLVNADKSAPPRMCQRQEFFDGDLTLTLFQEAVGKFDQFHKRLVPLVDNPLILPLPPLTKDPVGADIKDIPRAIAAIQEDWEDGGSTNAIAQWWLGREVVKRLQKLQNNDTDGSIDILLTGCEVSLWLLEQFASDLGQVFPKLQIRCISSNKLLGLLGQDFAVPQTGHQFNETSWNLDRSIVIIGSHSGGTFAPLACCNLLQAYTENIFVISSETDTQISKQLRQMNGMGGFSFRFTSFTSNVGMRPCEPCTVTVIGMHQVLTEILLYLMRKVTADDLEFASGGAYVMDDIIAIEDFNKKNVTALEDIVGVTKDGAQVPTETSEQLKILGRYWALHILEVPMSWIMCFVYIMGTVISGYPIVNGIAVACGFNPASQYKYILSTFDALIYVFCPQISIVILRIIQNRQILHRMTGRTIVIGDIPYVAQCAEAFCSKLFAVAYSAASVTVFSANPVDHLVHRMTHRVVRGSLLACGRPDGRLLSHTSSEASVCLSVNQASSIQNLGSTCESITIGHNPFKLPLTAFSIFLGGCRKKFLCEKALDAEGLTILDKSIKMPVDIISNPSKSAEDLMDRINKADQAGKRRASIMSQSSFMLKNMATADQQPQVSVGSILGSYSNYITKAPGVDRDKEDGVTSEATPQTFGRDFGEGTKKIRASLKPANLSPRKGETVENGFDGDIAGGKLAHVLHAQNMVMGEEEQKQIANDAFYGEHLHRLFPNVPLPRLIEEQTVAMRLYESRVASCQRLVSFFVMFHAMGKRVEDWWPAVSFGLLNYDMSRTHSIMRIATTASPVSGAEVRHRMVHLHTEKMVKRAKGLLLSLVLARRQYKRLAQKMGLSNQNSFSFSRAGSGPSDGSGAIRQRLDSHMSDASAGRPRIDSAMSDVSAGRPRMESLTIPEDDDAPEQHDGNGVSREEARSATPSRGGARSATPSRKALKKLPPRKTPSPSVLLPGSADEPDNN